MLRADMSDTEASPAPAAPADPQLAEADKAFDVGDYARVRELCDAIIARGPGPAAESARALRRRTEVDPVQLAILAGCLVLFLVIAYIYVL